MSKLWRVGEQEIDFVKQAIRNGLTGEFNAKFEEEFANLFGVNYAIGVNSGTSALHASLAAMGVGPGDEVIVPPLTFASTGFAPMFLGAKPIFADIDPETFNISPEDIRKKITPKTKVILPVSLYGLPADFNEINKNAKEHNLLVLEDNAECYLGTINDKLAGTFGDMSIFSMERSKHITTGNGGIIITNNEELAEKARKFSIMGYSTLKAGAYAAKPSKDVIQDPNFERHLMVSPNYRLPELCAAAGLSQLNKVREFVDMRKKVAKAYLSVIEGHNWIRPQKTPEGYVNSYFAFAVALDKDVVDFKTFRKIFIEEGGDPFYAAWKLTYDEPVLKETEIDRICPVAEDLQPRLAQLKTNYGDEATIQIQKEALERTIGRIESGT